MRWTNKGYPTRKTSPVPTAKLTTAAQTPNSLGASFHQMFGNHGVLHRSPDGLLTELKIGKPQDKYELEADRIAEQIIRISEPSTVPASSATHRAKPSSIHMPCSDCEQNFRQQRLDDPEKRLQSKKSFDGRSRVLPKLEYKLSALGGRGQPLPDTVRTFFEPRFGYNFQNVRLHTDALASKMARMLKARAFTVGQDIVLEAGQFVPGSLAGKRLLAHELTHVTQQQRRHTDTPDVQCSWREMAQWYEDYVSTVLDVGYIGYGYLVFGLDNRASAHLIHNILGSGDPVEVPTDFIFSSPVWAEGYEQLGAEWIGRATIDLIPPAVEGQREGEGATHLSRYIVAPQRWCWFLPFCPDSEQFFASGEAQFSIDGRYSWSVNEIEQVIDIRMHDITGAFLDEYDWHEIDAERLGRQERGWLTPFSIRQSWRHSDIEFRLPLSLATQVHGYLQQGGSMTGTHPEAEESEVIEPLWLEEGADWVETLGIPQTKPKIGQPHDKYEREADGIAEQIMCISDPRMPIRLANLHLSMTDGDQKVKGVSAPRLQVIPRTTLPLYRPLGTGEALSETVRAFFEPRFGYDLRNVRVHTNSHATHMAKSLNAKAFTVGSDITFGASEYSPKTQQGLQLLAHEIVHVVQQSRLSRSWPIQNTTEHGNKGEHKHVEAKARQRCMLQRPITTFLRSTGHDGAPDLQRRLIVSGTNEFDTRSFFRRHEFGNYRLVGLGERGIVVASRESDRPSGFEQEVYWALARSNAEYTRTLEQLRREISFRRSVVNAARSLAARQQRLRLAPESRFGEFRQIEPETGHLVRLNPRYWVLERQEAPEGVFYDVVMQTRTDVRPSSAIEDIWRHPERYAYECSASVIFIQYKALLRRIGATEFDRRFAPSLELRWTGLFGPGEELLELDRRGLEEIDVGSADDYVDLIPGDQTFFRGQSDFVENAIYLGREQYFSHPLGVVNDLSEIETYYGGWILPLTLSRYRYRWRV